MKSSGDSRYESLIKEVTALCEQLYELQGNLAAMENSYMTFVLSFDKKNATQEHVEKILQFIAQLKKRHAELVELVEKKVRLLRALAHDPVGAAGYLRQRRAQKELDEVEEKLKLLAVA